MRHWIQNVVDRWKTTSPKQEPERDYNPGKDFYKKLREAREREEKKRKEWKKRIKSMSTGTGYLPGTITAKNTFSSSYITSNTITSNTITSDAKIQIDGGPNGSMRVDVPLLVNGRDVMKELDEMRDALLLLKRDFSMEEKYPRLKELKDEYERALEKYKTFDAIKESK